MAKTDIAGFLNIDKPTGMTSHDVVAKIRRQLQVKKVGHAGTLDPLATGVLVICLGYATRLSEYAMASTKKYRALVQLGITTNTYDAEGEILAEHTIDTISRVDVESALAQFIGTIEQLPPMYSAIKQGGRKLYELARAGKIVERESRSVTIETIILGEWTPPQFVLEVTCSAGTYIRSLAHDLGQALGVGAHLAGLTRVASGAFTLDQAVPLANLLNEAAWQRYVLPPDTVLTHLPALILTAMEVASIQQGRPIIHAGEISDATLARAYTPDGNLIAVLKHVDRDVWQPHKVFLV